MGNLQKRVVLVISMLILALTVSACGEAQTSNTPQPTQSPVGISSESPEPEINADPIYGLGTVPQNASGNRQGVYYELFVRAFADSDGDGIGDFNGITQKLDYLNDGNPSTTADLGVTGIWLMPINETVSYHGYDVVDYYEVNPEYGTMADFEKMIQEANKRGIHIMMDLVLNHTSDKNEWFIKSTDPTSSYRSWYRWTKDGSEGYNMKASIWGHPVWNKLNGAYYFGLFWSGMPDLNLDNPDVRTEIKNIAGYWLDKGVDGFRLDAVPHIYATNELPNNVSGIEKTVEFWKEFTDFCHEKKPGSFIVGEVLDENTSTRATYLASLDSTFHIGLVNQISNALRGGSSKNNYLASFIANNYAQYAKANPNYIDAPVLTNHDQNRVIGQVQGKHELMKVAASIYLTIEGVPFIYYGEEIGMFGAKPDEDIRLPYVWGADDPLQTRWRQSKYEKAVVSVSEQQKNADSLLTHYKRLIRVRNENEALYAGKFKVMTSDNSAVVAYTMESQSQTAIILHNISKTPQAVTVGTEGYTLKFCQEKEGFENKDGKVVLPPLSSVIFVK